MYRDYKVLFELQKDATSAIEYVRSHVEQQLSAVVSERDFAVKERDDAVKQVEELRKGFTDLKNVQSVINGECDTFVVCYSIVRGTGRHKQQSSIIKSRLQFETVNIIKLLL